VRTLEIKIQNARKQESTAKTQANAANACFKPACPYYPDPKSELACPYFMMANYIGPNGNGGNPKKINWVGITSLILGIITIAMCWLSIISFMFMIFLVLSILSIIFGSIGLYFGQKNGSGKFVAGAGLVLGIISLLLTIFFLLLRLSWGYY
jgi:hypothetical protein